MDKHERIKRCGLDYNCFSIGSDVQCYRTPKGQCKIMKFINGKGWMSKQVISQIEYDEMWNSLLKMFGIE